MRRTDDDGVALVVALLVTVLAFLLMTGILAQSIHNIVQTGYARKRLAAANAAEAGLSWFANRLTSASLTAISTPSFGWQRDAQGWYVKSPEAASGAPDNAKFQLKVRYSTSTPCPDVKNLSKCSLSHMSDAMNLATYIGSGAPVFPSPVYAVVRSIGTVGTIQDTVTGRGSSTAVQRVLEEYVRLRAGMTVVAGGLSAISLCMGSGAKVSISGDLAINNQLVARQNLAPFVSNCPQTNANGDLVIGGGQYLRTTSWAPAFARGSVLIKGGGIRVGPQNYISVSGDLWAEGMVGIGCTSGATCVKSSSQCVTNGTIQCIKGDVLGSAIYQGPNGHIEGTQTACSPEACPPEAYFTEIRWDPSQWQGWSIVSGSESTLRTLINGATSPTVIHISGSNCSITMPTGDNVDALTLRTSVAVISECGYKFDPPGTTLKRSPSDCRTCSLLVLTVIPTDQTLAQVNCGDASATWSAPGPRDIRVKGNQNFGALADPGPGIFLYTPCYLWIEGNQCNGCTDSDASTPDDVITIPGGQQKTNSANEAPVQGQFIARYMIIKNGVRLIQNDIGDYLSSLPGLVSSFEQDVKFVREILRQSAFNNV